MTTVLARAAAVAFAAVAMLALLLGIAALALGHPERTAAYLAVMAVSAVVVALLMRRDLRRRRADEAVLLVSERAVRRRPRRPITFPIRETTGTFVFWYLVTVATDRILTGATSVFTLAVIAPFAAFMLSALTIAGRHMAFRLTAEEAADERVRGLDDARSGGRD